MTAPDDAEAEPASPGLRREVPADALSAGEFDRLKAMVAAARDNPAAVQPPEPVRVEPVRAIFPSQPEPVDPDLVDDDLGRLSRTGRILLNSAIALVLGGGIGLLAAWVAGRSDQPPPQPEAVSQQPVRAITGSPTRQPASPSAAVPSTGGTADVNSPRIAPTITAVDVAGTDVVLRWRDATRSEATFIVIQVVQGRGQPVTTVAPGTTEVALEGLQPAAGPFCFLVIAVVGQERGVSSIRCAGQGI
jgi:hypothetical protein